METIVLTVKEFEKILKEKLDEAFAQKKIPSEPKEEKLLARKDLARLFGVSLVTINDWMNKGLLPYYKLNTRVYFKKSEILERLDTLKKYGRNNDRIDQGNQNL